MAGTKGLKYNGDEMETFHKRDLFFIVEFSIVYFLFRFSTRFSKDAEFKMPISAGKL